MNKSYKKLPSLAELVRVERKIKQIPNRKGEFLRKIHYGCYLLCSRAGLRVSEAVGFDLASQNEKGLYRINEPKGKKERLVYVNKEVIQKLKANDWRPNRTNRWGFYHFLRKI
jgi:site-specific recombinase XerD